MKFNPNLFLTFLLLSCNSKIDSSSLETKEDVTLNFYTYQIGNFKNEENIISLIDSFNEIYPNIKINYNIVNGGNEDELISKISKKEDVDIIFGSIDKIVNNLAYKGNMRALNDLFTPTDLAEIYYEVRKACSLNTEIYAYPLAMSVYSMGLNYTSLLNSGSANIVDLDTHLISSDHFLEVIKLLAYYHNYEDVAYIYCDGQVGVNGTISLISNFYNSSFYDDENKTYPASTTIFSEAIDKLLSTSGISINENINGSEELYKFYNDEIDITFNLDIDTLAYSSTTNNGDKIVYMAFPCYEKENTALSGELYGLGMSNFIDDKKVSSAETFIKYICDSTYTSEFIKTTGYFPTRTAIDNLDLSNIYSDDQIRNEYQKLMPYFKNYYQGKVNYNNAKTAWWKMLKAICEGQSSKDALIEFKNNANT